MAGVSAALVGTFAVLAKKSIDNADNFQKMSERVGVSTETLSRMGFAAELGGTNLETVEKGLGKLAGSILDADDGLATYTRTFDRLGVSVRDGSGELKNTDTVLLEVADKFSQMEDGTEKTALAMDLFGKSGRDLIPVLNQGRDGLQAMFEESDALGQTIGTDTAEAAARFNDALTKLGSVLDGIINRILASGLLDGLVILAESLADLVVNSDDSSAAMGFLGQALTLPIKIFFMLEEQIAKTRVKVNEFLASTLELIIQADELLGAWSPFKDLAGDLRGKIDQFNLAAMQAADEAKGWQKKQDKLNDALKGMKKPAEVAKDRTDKLRKAMKKADDKATSMKKAVDLAKGIFDATNKIVQTSIDKFNVFNPAMGEADRKADTLKLTMRDGLDITLANVGKTTDALALSMGSYAAAEASAKRAAENLAGESGVGKVETALDDLGGKLETDYKEDVEGWGSVWENQVSTIVTDFSAGVADLIFEGESLAETMTGIFKEMGKTLVRGLVESLFEPVKGLLKELISSFAGFVGGLLGSSGSAVGGAVGGAVSVAGGVFNGLTGGIISAIGGIVGGIISALGGARGEDFVEEHLRFIRISWFQNHVPMMEMQTVALQAIVARTGFTVDNLGLLNVRITDKMDTLIGIQRDRIAPAVESIDSKTPIQINLKNIISPTITGGVTGPLPPMASKLGTQIGDQIIQTVKRGIQTNKSGLRKVLQEI